MRMRRFIKLATALLLAVSGLLCVVQVLVMYRLHGPPWTVASGAVIGGVSLAFAWHYWHTRDAD